MFLIIIRINIIRQIKSYNNKMRSDKQSSNQIASSSNQQRQQRVNYSFDSNQLLDNSIFNKTLLLKSHHLSQRFKYLKFDHQGNNQLIDQPKQFQPDYSYQKVHLPQDQNIILGQTINWSKDNQKLNSLINPKQKIVMRSLRKLYQKNFRPNFFQWIQQTKKISYKYYSPQIPLFFYQIDHLSFAHTQFLFINKTYSQNGLYRVVVNQDGRFRLITVNDTIPVFQQSNQHIWSVEQPWKMILIKVWACLNQGYSRILTDYRPFHFLQYFTSSNWKYCNLEQEGQKWINKYKPSLDMTYIVLQTKNQQYVSQFGLIPGSLAYNIVDIITQDKEGPKILIKSRFKHKWKGKHNIQRSNKIIPNNQDHQFRLQKNIILTKQQFFQMFCCAYIISLMKSNHHISEYYKVQIPKNTKKALYLKFSVKKQGFLDFSFIQSYKNKIQFQTNVSKIDAQKYHKEVGRTDKNPKDRFLKCKYMVIKSMKGQTKPFKSKLSTTFNNKQPQLTALAKYEAYEVEYLLGHRKGEAHFLMIQPGQYYFRLKSQYVNKSAIYYLNYCCSEKLNISQQIIVGEQREQILQNCMLSLLPGSANYNTKSTRIYTGNKFKDMGYGFIVVQNKTKSEKELARTILFEINVKQLYNEGYELKGKQHKKPAANNCIALQIKPQHYMVLILKRVQNFNQEYKWPPKSISLFKSKDLQIFV